MVRLLAHDNPVVIDNLATPPKTTGTTQIEWSKGPFDEMWERLPGAAWTQVDETRGNPYLVTLSAGQVYRAGVFPVDNGPDDPDPSQLADLVVNAVLRGPGVTELIVSRDENTGGTWHRRTYTTSVPTRLIPIGPSLTPLAFDADGIPRVEETPEVVPAVTDASGTLVNVLAPRTEHWVNLEPLAPGNEYFFACMFVDAAGNWEVDDRSFVTRMRKLMVRFPSVKIKNDGDPLSSSSATFIFRVSAGDDARARHILEEFNQGELDIDDGQTYSMGFAYVEVEPQAVPPDRSAIWVHSWGTDIDGFLEANEPAGDFGEKLSLPTGPAETILNGTMTMDCPPSADGADFHYTVKVDFTAEYA